jgi:hypothetical protein
VEATALSGASGYFKNRLPLLSTRVNVLVFDTKYDKEYGLVRPFIQKHPNFV